ncbi:metal ABC transporter permease [Schaalia sp. 19OD2882]|uniref:metal ABC transporter permease n=1 Tax=Schaalia sp. 19OD2882 TaxID=2794089 RepID=UPI001C1EBF1E|nr:metal ABC transporter permease [Schaalia sp. 19OD2882]QWW19018.1 metal ABC transporter permease [Schaalia sp. 19OD2882]
MTGLFDQFLAVMSTPLFQRSLLAALLVGLCAPVVGTYLVHRRMAMLGDGVGHVSLTGVALGWLAGSFAGVATPAEWAVPGALVVSLVGAVAIEWVRESGRASGDVALAMMFYGGIAGGVVLIGAAGGTSAQLNSYLFGSISTVSWADVATMGALAAVILGIGVLLAPALHSVTNDEEFARSTGLPVRGLSFLIAILSALTVVVAMRTVGSLLVSALMIVPVAIAQLWARSFRSTMAWAMGLGVVLCGTGLTVTAFVDLSPGATIVVGAIGLYAVGFAIRSGVVKARKSVQMRSLSVPVDHPERSGRDS